VSLARILPCRPVAGAMPNRQTGSYGAIIGPWDYNGSMKHVALLAASGDLLEIPGRCDPKAGCRSGVPFL